MLDELMLLLAAIFATAAAISRDDVYSAFYLGSAILFVALYFIGRISPILGIIVFAVYTASVIALIFLGYSEEPSGLSKYSLIALPLAFALVVALNAYMPTAEVAEISVDISSLKELIIPIAAGLASIMLAAEEVRRNDRGPDDSPLSHIHRPHREPLL